MNRASAIQISCMKNVQLRKIKIQENLFLQEQITPNLPESCWYAATVHYKNMGYIK